MNAINEFYKITVELVRLLENSQAERDVKILQVEALMAQRETLIMEITPPYSQEEMEVGRKLIQVNARLEQVLQEEKVSIQKDIKALQIKKESSWKYANPYQNVSPDGMFYDKKK
ncbi:flagellar protein FliT [Mesobacillus subterraneus]|uniref:flagellar protein FliT n=1 Tax=Mesobacillus subterraneus TaxID=285983 RepID=UPI00203E883E|nr:flagellar protein FliT [Mesobacillus subterraneus]MCM3663580.1 flagellar protein FliT [Mesobacillus subterraneus]MCM3683346.1 flagellar protein FliT [Mesobacillus subterraneus]